MAAVPARIAFDEIDRELTNLDRTLDAYDTSRASFVRELRVLFDAWVDTLADCPLADRPDVARQLGITEAELDDIIRRLRAINGRIQGSSNFNAERDNIMNFINRYRDVLAKIPGVPNPPLDSSDAAYARTSPTARENLDRYGYSRGAAPSASPFSPGSGSAPSSGSFLPLGGPSTGAAAASSPVLPLDVVTYVGTLRPGSKVTLKNKPDIEYTVVEINPARPNGNVIKVSTTPPGGGLRVENWIPPTALVVPPSVGGKSRRYKRTKRRRQKKSRKNKL
jgi:hypothetical protein